MTGNVTLLNRVGPAHTGINTWEGEKEVLGVRTNALLTAGVVSANDYGVYPIGQRSSMATSGSAFTAAASWAWGYDALGQVTSATHAADTAKNQGCTYYDIGNRKQATLGALTTMEQPQHAKTVPCTSK
ncbi:MAG: hypothetical protein NTV80_19930 [Verrucomicrobia bacterium]|nr:hypothetical protein [Verrucomicrobiota bacterium]